MRQRHHPNLPLPAVLTDRVASVRSLPAVLAWRLWQLLHNHRPWETRLKEPPNQHTQPEHVEDADDWHQHRQAVRTIGGPVAARAALHTAKPCPASRQRQQRE